MICRWCNFDVDADHEDKCIVKAIREEIQALKEGWLILEEEYNPLREMM